MPRIDPLQLLKCFSSLLTPEGGISSRDKVPRLVNLMMKFSGKLVNKCVYVLILKSTEIELVDMFMAEGGWNLIQTWLQDAVQTSNWDLVREILELLLITPVDVERLKLNILPKWIKNLSRRDELEGVARLSSQIVQQWLTIVKHSSNAVPQRVQVPPIVEKIEVAQIESDSNVSTEQLVKAREIVENPDTENLSEENNSEAINTGSFYKPSVRDCRKEEVVDTTSAEEISEREGKHKFKDDKKQEEKDKGKYRSNKSKISKSSYIQSSSCSKDKSRDKDRKKLSSSSKSSSSHSSKSETSSSSNRDKDKDRHKNNGSLKTSSSSSSSKSISNKERRDSKAKDKDKERDKDKQVEKDKDTHAKIKPQTIEKLGKIPKKPSSTTSPQDKAKENKENKDLKKKPFSVGIRKNSKERPETVKVFNSNMRSTGLEEEVKPAPPRQMKKPTLYVQLPTIPLKRAWPPREHCDSILPPQKKLKIDISERLGAIKIIPSKAKPMLQDSDLFMNGLTASDTAKKESKKRKRRPSVTKESSSSQSSSPADAQPTTPTSLASNNNDATTGTCPFLELMNIAPINFHQDTLSSAEESTENAESCSKENTSKNVTENDENKDIPASLTTPTDDANGEESSSPKKVKLGGGLKGILLYAKTKGSKKSISWKAESNLVEIRYFELDKTERVNVTKTFRDMVKMKMTSERMALKMSRKIVGEDKMKPQIMWNLPYVIEQSDPLAVPGHKSLEKDIQFAREKSVLQALYFDKMRIPDSPEEPIPENHQMSDPVFIPLEDVESQEIDFRSTPWLEPKRSPPQVEPQIPPHMYLNMPGIFNSSFNSMPPPQFQGMPPRLGSQGPGVPGPVSPENFIPPNIKPNGNRVDLKSTPWPERKESHPQVEPQIPPHISPNMPGTFNPLFSNIPPPQFQGMPPRLGSQGPGGTGLVSPGNVIPPNINPNENRMNLRITPWQERKGSPAQVEPQIPHHISPNMPGAFNLPFNNMPPSRFQEMPPRFGSQGPGGPRPVSTGNFIPPNIIPNGSMMGPPNMVSPNKMMNQGPMNVPSNMFPPGRGPDNFESISEFPMFGNQSPSNNMNMFPLNNFNNQRLGSRGFRRGDGGSGGKWVRMNGPNNRKRSGGGSRRLCKKIQNHGYFRNSDNCPFVLS